MTPTTGELAREATAKLRQLRLHQLADAVQRQAEQADRTATALLTIDAAAEMALDGRQGATAALKEIRTAVEEARP